LGFDEASNRRLRRHAPRTGMDRSRKRRGSGLCASSEGAQRAAGDPDAWRLQANALGFNSASAGRLCAGRRSPDGVFDRFLDPPSHGASSNQRPRRPGKPDQVARSPWPV